MTATAACAHPPGGKPRGLIRLAVCWLLGACLLWSLAGVARAQANLDPALLPGIEAATFEVVAAKPPDPLTYTKPLPMKLLPYQKRTDKYYSIGTAFAIGPNRFVTAGHVLMTGYNSLWGPPELRDAAGHVYAIGKIEKFSLRRDFVVFSLADPPHIKPLAIDTHPALNQVVYSVGNALGTGVVIRNGLYTSNTPEAQDGKWNWIRFSAAASPGNSGGPLLDGNGKVIGVVLMKSPNENLNYALPMSEVLDAPRDIAHYDKRMSYQFDAFNATRASTFKGHFALPKSLAGFFAAYGAAFKPWLDSQLHALLASQAANLFPNGDGAQQVLYGSPQMGDFPRLLIRNSNGIWAAHGSPDLKINLPANGYVAGGNARGNILFHLRKPDTIPERQFHHDPKGVMDLLLRTGFLKRRIGPQKIRVTSLGKPGKTSTWIDRWGRHWQVWLWPIPYADGVMTMFALPTPDGYAILARLDSTATRHDTLINLRALTNFVTLPYDGTLKQWQAYLTETALLPKAFDNIHINFAYDKDFHYASQRIAFSFTPALQKIKPDSMLTLGFDFIPDTHGKVVWDVAQIWLAAANHDHHWISLRRVQKPPADLNDSFQSFWKKVRDKRHPFDGMAFSENDITRINAVAPSPQAGNPPLRYVAYVYQPGTRPQAEMKQKLELLLENVKVNAP